MPSKKFIGYYGSSYGCLTREKNERKRWQGETTQSQNIFWSFREVSSFYLSAVSKDLCGELRI